MSKAQSLVSKGLGRLWRLPPQRNAVELTRDLRVPMRDGVHLLADHYAPASIGARPTLLIRCPYGRGAQYALLTAWPYAERGYHVLFQSTRGTFGSGGRLMPGHHEADDATDTVAWLREQPWFDGRLGVIGVSYLGYTAWNLALDPPPELRAAVITMAPHDMFDAGYGRGPYQLYDLLMWSSLLASQERLGTVGTIRFMAGAERTLRPALDRLPLAATGDGIGAPWYREWIEHPQADDPYWAFAQVSPALDRITAPTLLIGGFHDFFADQTVAQYQHLRQRGVDAALTMGPWTHLTGDQRVIVPETLAWLDHHLAGDGPPPRRLPVRVWESGLATWRGLTTWPPATTPRTWHLRVGARLATEPPTPAERGTATSFRYDPLDPTPSVGGRMMSTTAGSRDNTELEARPDVLTFTTPVLDAAVEVFGKPTVDVWLSADNPHADLFVRLCDVDEKGVSRNLSDEIRRLPGTGVAPGELRAVRLTLTDLAHTFRVGHRVRLQVSGGAHPRYSRHPGVPGDPAQAVETATVTQSVHHDPDHPSTLTLPTT
ncbi:MAG TPA: CocE/NonD family hydrolase [Pseudonocardiaceae bacterium]|nr:CocE/NonD family hydrolase [Pseudonocardiaceae bacterium]